MNFKEQIGRNIKKEREKLGLTQVNVAERAGISANYFAKIERGEINMTLEKLHDIFPSVC